VPPRRWGVDTRERLPLGAVPGPVDQRWSLDKPRIARREIGCQHRARSQARHRRRTPDFLALPKRSRHGATESADPISAIPPPVNAPGQDLLRGTS